jgi:Ribonuclease G/E
MSEPAPEQKSVRQMSDEEIVQTFDRLVEAWEGREDTRARREAFDREYRSPERPAPTIESTEALIVYNRQKWRYEQKREELEDLYAEHDANYSTSSEIVRLLLPSGHTLVHAYRGDHPEFQGAEHIIQHEATTPGAPDTSGGTEIIVRSRRTRPLS